MIDHIDHIVLATADEAACVGFYVTLLGIDLCFIASIPA